MILNMRDEDIMQQAKDLNWEKVRAFMASEGQVAGLTHAVFIKISANLMDKLGVAPGGEFRMGFQEGTKVGSTILLGDRSIRMTFKRALRALPIWQQLRLFYMLFTSVAFDLDISPEDIEKMKNSDMVEMLTGIVYVYHLKHTIKAHVHVHVYVYVHVHVYVFLLLPFLYCTNNFSLNFFLSHSLSPPSLPTFIKNLSLPVPSFPPLSPHLST